MWRWWYGIRRLMQRNRPIRVGIRGLLGVFVIVILWSLRGKAGIMLYEEYGVFAAALVMEQWLSVETWEFSDTVWGKTEVVAYLEELQNLTGSWEDPAYERLLAAEWEKKIALEQAEAMRGQDGDEANRIEENRTEENRIDDNWQKDDGLQRDPSDNLKKEDFSTANMQLAEAAVLLDGLNGFDQLIRTFYTIHPTTAVDAKLIDPATFITRDLSLPKDPDRPQILIYHTHSQEEYADYPQNPEATIVGVGARLAEHLRENGYQVIHDRSVYDVRNGKLDRSQAYTYALEEISGILQEYPTIQVVLDLHRDGVDEKIKLLTEINGTPSAKIMFFNGTSQTPDGPIEYLPNPNREANLAFSFQMQLLAMKQYPGFTRNIYLKGLRYNQHVRERTALIEVGAQTNTYAEALEAMGPLAELICQVLECD